MRKILVTGGTGFIGSHVAVELVDAGYTPVIFDNLSNSEIGVLKKIAKISGVQPIFYEGDIRIKTDLESVFEQHIFDAVMHFAGVKAVGESVAKPLMYYQNNVLGSVHLLQAMREHGCKRIVFSSSCTVYGHADELPIKESSDLLANNPYGKSKLMVENIIRDTTLADADWRACLLRYFNPIGAHRSGELGEKPVGIPNNLVPYILQVAAGKLQRLPVYGNDYDTPDGTGLRDYIHVVDLAKAHIKALKGLRQGDPCTAFNIGTGKGYSVMQVIEAFEKASGRKIPFEFLPRRAGDVASAFADNRKSLIELDWAPEYDLNTMMRDLWNWQCCSDN